MAQWHLDELRAALERRGWRMSEELPGNDYDISATWKLIRSGTDGEVLIDFDGLDDMNTVPIAESFGCRARGTGLKLYFRRRGKSDPPQRERWRSDLMSFVSAVG